MKKIVAMAVVAAVTVSMVCAQITVGAKGTFGMNWGSATTDEGRAFASIENFVGTTSFGKLVVGGGGSIYGRYNMPFHAPLGVQLELGIFANNGDALEVDGSINNNVGKINVTGNASSTYLSMDIPLIVTYDISAGPVVITPMVGVNFSIPLGKLKYKTEYTAKIEGYREEKEEFTEEFDIDPRFIPGIVAGVEVGLPLGPGSLVADLRYVNDFTNVTIASEGESMELFTRRNFNISVGYALKF